MDFLQKKIYFIGGKGGVGKSTSSAAFASYLSSLDKKVLLVSTDPAHNTGDLFHLNSNGELTTIHNNLDFVEIDSERESKRYIAEVKNNLRGLVKVTMVEEVHRQIELAAGTPGAEEAALFERLTSIIMEEVKNYDAIVFDTAPTGHTIRLLTLPQLMGVWMDGMLERRKQVNEKNFHRWMDDGESLEDPIYEKLQERRRKFSSVRKYLLDSNLTEYIFVLNAERLPILETRKAMDILKKHEIDVKTLFVNKLIPEDVDGAFMEKRKANEQIYRIEIEKVFPEAKKVMIPMLESDISTLAHLRRFTEFLQEGLEKIEIR
ncbi:ArsA family ATPase [Robertmurraya massiliosenegalensis]|uniref:ArsA family ATPase n=1 Tax=Robertmurraya TaxID=2837507 RepID=UPI0039A596DE